MSLLPTILQPIALTVMLIYFCGLVSTWSLSTRAINIVMGCLFTVGVVASMAAPLTLADGIIIDMRNLLVGAAMALLGPVAGAIALVGGCLMRLLIGGDGAMLGVFGMTGSAASGLLWRYLVRPHITSENLSYIVLGLMISAHLFIALLLDEPVRSAFFGTVAPIIFGMNLLGSLMLGILMRHELVRLEKAEEWRHAAETDPLTNLLNRRKLSASAEHLTSDFKNNHGRAVLCFDIDHFKQINDQYGHKSGDIALKAVSDRISTTLRPTDLFSRLGGDEFAIVLPNVTYDVAQLIAARCCSLIAETPVNGQRGPIAMTISMGGDWSNKNEDLEVMLDRADAALYQAKESGRNTAVFSQASATHLPLAG